MIYTELTKMAMRIAFDAHKDQTDKAGMPYVFHPWHLAEQMETEDEVCAALLHDVAEDTDITLDDLRAYGFSENVMIALALLTHDKNVEYEDYIKNLRTNALAAKIKLADLRHNSNPSRLDALDIQRFQKYKKAVMLLHHLSEKELQAEPLKRELIPLDDIRLWFLSVFRNENHVIIKYSIDVEKAEDSHYEMIADEYKRLAVYFGTEDTIAALKQFVCNHREQDFVALLDRLEILYTPFHYDSYES